MTTPVALMTGRSDGPLARQTRRGAALDALDYVALIGRCNDALPDVVGLGAERVDERGAAVDLLQGAHGVALSQLFD